MFYQHFFIKSFRKHQSTICVNFTEVRQIVCKLYKLSTNFLTVPRMYIFSRQIINLLQKYILESLDSINGLILS